MDAGELLAKKKLRTVTIPLDLGGGEAELTFTAIPRKQYRLLLEEHPGVEEKDDWNPDTFPPALIAACATEPEFTLEQATELWDEWEPVDSGRVFLAVWNLNESSGKTGFILPGSAQTGGSGQN